jgi:hypothetical protein
MSYELYNISTSVYLTFSKQFFVKVLELGELYGWQPRRTQPPLGIDFSSLNAEWLGGYLTNDGQSVVDNDAKWLAASLEKSLDDISDENPKFDWDPKFWMDDDLPEWLSPEERALIYDKLQDGLLDIIGLCPLEYFAGDEKHYLVKFIRFCRLGSFVIN